MTLACKKNANFFRRKSAKIVQNKDQNIDSRSSEPTPATGHDKKKAWHNFYFELPTLEESMSAAKSPPAAVSTFGGVDSNTVRPFNQSFIWSPQVSIL
jgi:hypothetical protein